MIKLSRYTLQVHGGQDGSGGTRNVRAQIQLFDDRNAMAGWIDFHFDGTTLPEDRKDEQHIIMCLPLSMVPTVAHLLDNAGEVYLKWQEATKNAVLSTGSCEVGAGNR